MGIIKKLFFLLLLCFMTLPSQVFAKESIEIKSIELDSKSDNTTIKSEPTFTNLVMNFDFAFKSTSDFAKYKIVVKNDTNTDYIISKDTSFNQSEYITYKYEMENELKAKEETILYLTITYTKEVDSSLLVNNKYSETNQAKIQLLNNEGQIINVPDTINNPNTGNNLTITMIIILLLASSVTFLLVLNNKKEIKYISILIAIGICAIPALVYAVETLKITINVNVEISESYSANYIIFETIKTSDKNNYTIFDYTEFGIDYQSCNIVEGKDGYELCAIIYKTEDHVPGEIINIPAEKTFHSFNGEGNLIENTVPMNNIMQVGIWDYYTDSSYIAHIQRFNVFYWWSYPKDFNNYDDVDEMRFTGNIDNQWSNTSWPAINLYSPNSFTMPRHDAFFFSSLSGIPG